MKKNQTAPRFLIADNPMEGAECYIVVKNEIITIIRVSDWEPVHGVADDALTAEAMRWYADYTRFLSK